MFDRTVRSLHFAVRLPVLLHYLGQGALVLSLLLAVPATVSVAVRGFRASLSYLAIVGCFLVLGVGTRRLRSTQAIQRNEALVVTGLLFALPGVLMSVPFMGYGLPFIDSLFESISAVTTTGLTTLSTVEDKPVDFLFARAWLQWVGGLGVLALTVAFVIQPGVAARRLGFSEREWSDLAGSTRAHARRVLAVYAGLTVGGVALLLLLGSPLADALIHVPSAVSTGGFSRFDDSIGALALGPRVGLTLLSLAGAISFALYYLGRYKRPLILLKDEQTRTFLSLIAVVGVLLALSFRIRDGLEWSESLSHAIWMAISAQTTTGFSTISAESLDPASRLVLMCAMIVGGEMGSTAGGIKVLRFLILLRLLRLALARSVVQSPGSLRLTVAREPVDPQEVEQVSSFYFAYLLVIVLSWAIFLAYGSDPSSSLFEVVSAIGTVGLSAGVARPELSPVLKAVLSVDMLLGRVEILALAVVVLPDTWLGKRRSVR